MFTTKKLFRLKKFKKNEEDNSSIKTLIDLFWGNFIR